MKGVKGRGKRNGIPVPLHPTICLSLYPLLLYPFGSTIREIVRDSYAIRSPGSGSGPWGSPSCSKERECPHGGLALKIGVLINRSPNHSALEIGLHLRKKICGDELYVTRHFVVLQRAANGHRRCRLKLRPARQSGESRHVSFGDYVERCLDHIHGITANHDLECSGFHNPPHVPVEE
jgi:hypothetical protein